MIKKEVIDISGEKIEMIKDMKKNSKNAFVYLDPPYYPISKRKDGKISPYRIYNNEFKPVDFLKLKIRCDELTRAGIPFVLSSSDCEFIRILFREYIIVDIKETRVMKQTKGKGSRPKENCLIITNFKQKEDFMKSVDELNSISNEKKV